MTKEYGPASSYITARDLGSLASLYSTNNGEPFGRGANLTDLLDAATQWSKDVRRMVAL